MSEAISQPGLSEVQTAAKRLAIVDLLHGRLRHWPGHRGYRSDGRERAMLHREDVILALAKAGIVRFSEGETFVELTKAGEPLARECAEQFKRVLPKESAA